MAINRRWLICVGAMGLVACTSSSEEASEGSAPTAAIAESSTTSADTADSDEDADGASPTSTEAAAADTSSADPLRAQGDAPPSTVASTTASAWISRKSMSASAIELTWSSSPETAEYQIHRVVRTEDVEPELEAMTADNLIHSDTDGGRFTDAGVTAGTRYWYGVRELDVDGAVLAYGWHRADAVDDVEPPSTVPELRAMVVDGEVLVTWLRPDENYELHGYRVFRLVEGQEPESVAVTWRLDQTSFLDDEPPEATVGYEVVAFDFHWNESAPARVSVELP